MSFAEDDPGLLEGAVVQRVDVGEDALALRVRAPGRSAVVLIAAAPRARGVGILEGKSRPRLAGAAPADAIRLRKRLEGTRIAWIEDRRVVVTRGADRLAIQIGGAGPCGVRGLGVHDLAADEPTPAEAARDRDADPWLTRGAELAEALGAGALAGAREALAAAIRRALAKIARRAEAGRGDLARVDEAAAQAARAALFVAEAARAPRGATSLTITDWSSGEPVEASLALDPARPAREQIDALFKRARRPRFGSAQTSCARSARLRVGWRPTSGGPSGAGTSRC